MKTIITFGSEHLEWMHNKLNPLWVALVIEAENENMARQVVLHSRIGKGFAGLYPYEEHIEAFKYMGLSEYTLELLEANIVTKAMVMHLIKKDAKEWEESHDYWNGSREPFRNAPHGWDVNVIGETYGTPKNEFKAIVTACKKIAGGEEIGDEVLLSFPITKEDIA